MYLASLPWYDLAEVQESTDVLWSAIAACLRTEGVGGVPDALDRRLRYHEQWQVKELLLGQACGYDVVCANEHDLQVVGVPRFDIPGCEGNRYRSYVIVRVDDPWQNLVELRGKRCVINSPRSHSGMNSIQDLVAPLARKGRFFGEVIVSESHVNSLKALHSHEADVAAIDCVTYTLLERNRPAAIANTRILCSTQAMPAPPFVTSAESSSELVASLRRAIPRAITQVVTPHGNRLGLLGMDLATVDTYSEIRDLERSAHEFEYRELSEQPLPWQARTGS